MTVLILLWEFCTDKTSFLYWNVTRFHMKLLNLSDQCWNPRRKDSIYYTPTKFMYRILPPDISRPEYTHRSNGNVKQLNSWSFQTHKIH